MVADHSLFMDEWDNFLSFFTHNDSQSEGNLRPWVRLCNLAERDSALFLCPPTLQTHEEGSRRILDTQRMCFPSKISTPFTESSKHWHIAFSQTQTNMETSQGF